MSLETLFIFSFIEMVAGFIDAIARAGGLITLPALLIAGLSLID